MWPFLAYLVCNINPVGNHVTGNAFIGIDFYKEAGFDSRKKSWFLV